ncbi:tetraacyldisaccharide 4'-kinase, partial [Escherichia coli]|nr:tetraacyldisaccharide 4'-kinase [Escherichia coli]
QTPIQNCLSFCALGNPNNFFEQLKQENFKIVSTEKFPDHHFYTQKDVSSLEAKARKANAEILITTAKDAVKLINLKFDLPCFVVESEIIFEAENNFPDWLTAKLKD